MVDLIRGRSGPTSNAAILLDIGSWADAGVSRARRGNGTAAQVLAAQRDDAAALLRAAGWRVAVARADHTVDEVWSDLGGPAGGPLPSMSAGAMSSVAMSSGATPSGSGASGSFGAQA